LKSLAGSVADWLTGASAASWDQALTSWNQVWAGLGIPQIAIMVPFGVLVVIYVLFHVQQE
jgi:TRAP-type C4-dicarboxylate transport system permease small subunit